MQLTYLQYQRLIKNITGGEPNYLILVQEKQILDFFFLIALISWIKTRLPNVYFGNNSLAYISIKLFKTLAIYSSQREVVLDYIRTNNFKNLCLSKIKETGMKGF